MDKTQNLHCTLFACVNNKPAKVYVFGIFPSIINNARDVFFSLIDHYLPDRSPLSDDDIFDCDYNVNIKYNLITNKVVWSIAPRKQNQAAQYTNIKGADISYAEHECEQTLHN